MIYEEERKSRRHTAWSGWFQEHGDDHKPKMKKALEEEGGGGGARLYVVEERTKRRIHNDGRL